MVSFTFNICQKIAVYYSNGIPIYLPFARRLISTSIPLAKSRPSTVGVPAWAKAANKRRAQVLLLEKNKTAEQLQAEMRLAKEDSNKHDFFTSTQVGEHKMGSSESTLHTSTHLTSSSDGEMFVFYHPEKKYPHKHPQALKLKEDFSTSKKNNDLTEAQVSEIKLLQKLDPKLWTVNVLSDMYKVDPLVIINTAPLDSHQQLHLEVEQEFLAQLSDYEKQEYFHFKDRERKKQLRKVIK